MEITACEQREAMIKVERQTTEMFFLLMHSLLKCTLGETVERFNR